MIKNGSVVSFEYTVSDESGKVLESSKGQEPMTYTHGQQEIIPALEKGLSEMEINEERNICIPPEEAYGPVDPEGFKEVPKEEIPAEKLKVGTTLHVRGKRGEDFDLRVYEIKEQTVVLDLNHPLAGKTLSFDVKAGRPAERVSVIADDLSDGLLLCPKKGLFAVLSSDPKDRFHAASAKMQFGHRPISAVTASKPEPGIGCYLTLLTLPVPAPGALQSC